MDFQRQPESIASKDKSEYICRRELPFQPLFLPIYFNSVFLDHYQTVLNLLGVFQLSHKTYLFFEESTIFSKFLL